MSEGLIGCFDRHHLQQTCKRLNGLPCASWEEEKKKEAFLHFHSNYTQWFRRAVITIVILRSYSICADFQRSELWRRKLPDISYFPGKWLTSYMFICTLISQTQLTWRHSVDLSKMCSFKGTQLNTQGSFFLRFLWELYLLNPLILIGSISLGFQLSLSSRFNILWNKWIWARCHVNTWIVFYWFSGLADGRTGVPCVFV